MEIGMEWFYATEGNRMGPVGPVLFAGLISEGKVKPETLVWSNGMTDWVPYQQIQADTAVCVSSNGIYWQRDMVPYEGKFISVEHKEAFFQRLREGVQQPGNMVYGNFWPRFCAKFIDGAIGWVVGLVLNGTLSVVFFGQYIFSPNPATAGAGKFWAYTGVSTLVGVAWAITYAWFFLSRYEATPGKMALGLKVVRSDGSRLSTGRIIGRYFSELLSGMILGIGYIMAAFDEEKRALHDRICDTRVIKK